MEQINRIYQKPLYTTCVQNATKNNFSADNPSLSNALPNWGYVLYPYLIGELLLTAFVLVNTVTKLKKFRLWVNYLWFLPGAAMLACPEV